MGGNKTQNPNIDHADFKLSFVCTYRKPASSDGKYTYNGTVSITLPPTSPDPTVSGNITSAGLALDNNSGQHSGESDHQEFQIQYTGEQPLVKNPNDGSWKTYQLNYNFTPLGTKTKLSEVVVCWLFSGTHTPQTPNKVRQRGSATQASGDVEKA
jgi:hypothetical protein